MFSLFRLRVFSPFPFILVKSGMSLSDIRDILGHSTVQMTEHYARVGIEYLNAELKDESAYVWDVRPLAYA